jgi:pilus assembly protein Flp/PilA
MRRLWRNSSGASLIEYSVLLGVMTILIIVAIAVAGSWLYGAWTHLLATLPG